MPKHAACTVLGRRAVKTHAASIQASLKRRALQDELNYERSRGAATRVERDVIVGLERDLRVAKAAEGVTKARFEKAMTTYRRRCR
jgi:hypothetical protein